MRADKLPPTFPPPLPKAETSRLLPYLLPIKAFFPRRETCDPPKQYTPNGLYGATLHRKLSSKNFSPPLPLGLGVSFPRLHGRSSSNRRWGPFPFLLSGRYFLSIATLTVSLNMRRFSGTPYSFPPPSRIKVHGRPHRFPPQG